jgi:hypothetical protein
VIIENCAVGSSKEDIYLDLNEGYGNARVKSKKSNTAIPIKMLSLLEIIKKNKIEYITSLKIDVEG